MADTNISKPTISNATVKKPSFLGELIKYGMKEEVEPRAKELFRNLITGSIDMTCNTLTKMVDKAVYPDGDGPKRVTKGGTVSEYHPKVNYSTSVYSSDGKKKESINTRSSIDVNYIWVETEQQAKDIVSTLIELIDNYNKAKVADLYEMVKVTPNFTDYKYGWTEKERNEIGYCRDKGLFLISVPKPVDVTNV